MSEIYLRHDGGRKMLRLGRMLGEGASGKVFQVADMPGVAAKLYHGGEEARRYETKIETMLGQPPRLSPALHQGARYPPTAKLHDRMGNFAGFLMPEIDFARSTSLVNLLQKNSRKLEGISDYYGYRVLVARNLASVFAELHRAGHHMIDLKPANLRFYPALSWMAVVDADGFSIADAGGGDAGRIAAAQLSDEYIAPESWKRPPVQLGLEQDLFALAAIIFQLLNNGVHPFAGTAARGAATDLQTRILEGLYPYALTPHPELTPSTASVHGMFRRQTRAMFDAAFLTRRRPSAAEWRDHLHQLCGQLTPCAKRPSEHVHFGAGCGLCGHEARVNVVRSRGARAMVRRAPFPTLSAPSSHHASARAPVARRGSASAVRSLVRGTVGAALLGGTLVASDQVWQQMLAHEAYAATPPTAARAYEGRLGPLAEAGDYLIVPPRHAHTVALREGPGDDHPMIAALGMRDALLGSGIRVAEDGVVWVLVTRGDSASGFVRRSALIERDAVAPPLECPAGKTCVDGAVAASERALGERYRELLGRAGRVARARLEAGQRRWEAERRGCGAAVLPVPCRLDANARRAAELDNLGAPDGRG